MQEEERKRQEEQKQQEEERKKREGWLISNNDGTVTDPRTGLMWAAKDNEHDINLHDAKKYCENYRGGGYKDWRMPTVDELHGLYQSGSGYNVNEYTVYITELIRLSSYSVWASDTLDDGSSAFCVRFHYGHVSWLVPPSCPYTYRALPVRVISK